MGDERLWVPVQIVRGFPSVSARAEDVLVSTAGDVPDPPLAKRPEPDLRWEREARGTRTRVEYR